MGITERLKHALRRRAYWRGVLNDRDAAEEKIIKALDAVDQDLDRKRKRIAKLRKQERRPEKRETLADEIEELHSAKDVLLERLDVRKHKSWQASQALRKQQKRVKELRERRKRKREDKQGQLTKHFHISEFDCRDGTNVPKDAVDALEAWCRNVGEPVRARFGQVTVHSGYRTTSWNAHVGGEANSVHIYDLHPAAVAVDFSCATGSAADWFNFTAGKADGRGRYATFHHADNRNRIGWPDAVWSG